MSDVRALPLAPGLDVIVRPSAFEVAPIVVRDRPARLDVALREAAERARTTVPAADTASLVRRMYKAIGLDPTKVRPSSESLLRRVKRGEPLPRVNSAVDVVNWCSMESQLPFGLYDGACIRGTPDVRLGRAGEAYAGIRKDVVHVAGRLTVADEVGPFGNPTSDSARTMVTTRTTRVFVVIFAPSAVPASYVDEVATVTRERLRSFGG